MGSPLDDADLVLAVRGGDQAAFGELFARWSDRCYDVARRIVHDDGLAAEVAQDVFLTAWQQIDSLRDPAAFGGWVLRSARNRALNRLEKERRSVSVADDAPVLALVAAADAPDRDAEAAMTATDHRELVDAATVVLGEREASVLDLHLRHGLSAAELADELGVTTNNAHQLIFRTKKKLAAGIRAWVLVRGGRPACPVLAVALDDAGVHEFSRAAVGVIGDHVQDCDECTARQASVLDPAALFAAVPVVAIPAGLRAGVVDGLRSAGVPVAPADLEPPSLDLPSTPEPVSAQVLTGPPAVTSPGGDERRRRRILAAAAVLLVILAGTIVATRGGRGDTEVATGPSTTAGPSTTDAAPRTDPGEPRRGTTTAEAGSLPAPVPTTTADDGGLAADTTAPADQDVTTAPAGEQQPSPTTTAPSSSPTTAPPRATTTVATTTTTRPPAPVVRRFAAVSATTRGGDCPPARFATTIWWSVEGATSITIEATGFSTITDTTGAGKHVACRIVAGPPAGGWTLTAVGPGGTTEATA